MSKKFNKQNTPSGFYVYLFLRKNWTPYYVGKGKGDRAWHKRNGTKAPSDKSRIVIVEWDLTEAMALIRERFYISWFGRKDIGTGILLNKTDGGDGLTNPSEESIRKMIENRRWYKQPTGKDSPKYGTAPVINVITGEKLTVSIHDSRYKEYPYIRNNGDNKGLKHGRYIHTTYRFENVVTGEIVEKTPYEFRTQYNVSGSGISGLINGGLWKYGVWKLAGSQRPTFKRPRRSELMAGKGNLTYDPKVYIWCNTITGEIVEMTGYDFRMQYSYVRASDVSDMKRGYCRKKWRIISEIVEDK